MNLRLVVHKAIQPIPQPLRRIALFLLVGGSGVVVNLGVFSLVLMILGGMANGSNQAVMGAGVAGFLVSVLTNFILNDRWTWKDREKRGGAHFLQRMVKYYLASLAGGVVQMGTLVLLTRLFGAPPLAAQALGIALGTVLNYCASHFWAFKNPTPAPDPTANPGTPS